MSEATGTGKYEQLLARCRSLEPVPTAVAHPCERTALESAIEAGAIGLIVPILVGPAATIREVAEQNGIDLGWTRIVDAPHSHASAAKAVELVRQGEAEVLRSTPNGRDARRRRPVQDGRSRTNHRRHP
jgi:phosphate acetyltransferase